jgi:diaminohydroxyphosphoribosylaminopyrimidine deaminase/5-amino-6-(5-phosphoribosylamino)uracil reductase
MTDQAYMMQALALARARLGQTAPNPSVGCVIVRDGTEIGAAATAPTGRPHAEPQALSQAGAQTEGATIYVTLEPCAHQGATPPCVDALIAAHPARVVIATTDPDPRTAGASIRRMKAAGIIVDVGVCETAAVDLNGGFFKRLVTGMPLLQAAESGAGYDAPFDWRSDETATEALLRQGRAGLTRLWVRAGSAEAEALRGQGLLDDDAAVI